MVSEQLLRLTVTLGLECLNPCYSGRWSRRVANVVANADDELVLILVIAVDGLGVSV